MSKMIDQPHILVDLDATLAHYDGWTSAYDIGEPIKPMVDRVKKLIKEGKEVRIFTARVSEEGPYGLRPRHELEKTRDVIRKWCKTHIGKELEITNKKTFHTVQIIDDRCLQIIPNLGITIVDYLYTESFDYTLPQQLPTPSPIEKEKNPPNKHS